MTAPAPADPDPIVQTALRLLPVPDHGPEFWAQLDARLDLEPPAGAPVEPALAAGPPLVSEPPPVRVGRQRPLRAAAAPQPTTPRVVMTMLRRRSNVLLAMVALVAALVVLLAVLTLVRGRSLTGLDTTKAGASTEGSAATLIAFAPPGR